MVHAKNDVQPTDAPAPPLGHMELLPPAKTITIRFPEGP